MLGVLVFSISCGVRHWAELGVNFDQACFYGIVYDELYCGASRLTYSYRIINYRKKNVTLLLSHTYLYELTSP